MLRLGNFKCKVRVVVSMIQMLVISLAIAAPDARAASIGAKRGPSAHHDSVRGFMRMAAPKVLVLGEQFEVVVSVPKGTAEEDRQGVGLRWYAADETGRKLATTEERQNGLSRPGEIKPEERRPGTHVIKVHAPFDRPGRYELRLFRCPHYCTALLDGLIFEVVTGADPELLRLEKRRFKAGEAIDVTVKLPPNRYYFGHWSGPTVQLVPIEIGPRRLSAEEAAAWLQRCGSACSTWLGKLVLNAKSKNPLDGGHGAIPGTYRVNMAELAKADKIAHPLFAPNEPGRYEVRFYDRGFDWKWRDYAEIYLASHEIVVEPIDKPAVAAKATKGRLYFVRKTEAGFAPITDGSLRHGDRFAVELVIDDAADPQSERRNVKLVWGQGPAEARDVTVIRDPRAKNIFRSDLFIVEKP